MTCIVAVEHEGKVWVGGDAAASDESEIVSRWNDKVFSLGEFVIGYSGSFRIGQLLQYAFSPPEQTSKQTDMEYMVVDFVGSLRALLKDNGAVSKENEVESHDAGIVVGYRGRIYLIESDFHVGRALETFVALGDGAPFARGALHAIRKLEKDLPLDDKILSCLEIAEACCASVRGPFKIIHG